MSSQSSIREPLVDLSDYYVMKKFNDGWLVAPIDGGESRFVFKAQLVEMGYLDGREIDRTNLDPTPSAIVVPTVLNKRRSSSPIAQNVGRADLDPNWRKK